MLRSLDYSESSTIATLFTETRGKIAVLAKGARRPKSKFGATLQPMTHAQVVFYYKPTRSLQMLSESSHIAPYRTLRRSLTPITIGLRMVELADALLGDESRQPAAYELLVRVLRRLDDAPPRRVLLWPFFQIRLAAALGIAPAIQRDRVEAVDEEGWLSLSDGGVYPLSASPSTTRKASRAALRAYAIVARAPLDTVLRMECRPAVRQELQALVDAYLRYHFDTQIPDRCRRVLAQLRSV